MAPSTELYEVLSLMYITRAVNFRPLIALISPITRSVLALTRFTKIFHQPVVQCLITNLISLPLWIQLAMLKFHRTKNPSTVGTSNDEQITWPLVRAITSP
jgi:hypothetical protein